MNKVKLTKLQQEIVDKMKDGWTMQKSHGSFAFFPLPYIKGQDGFCIKFPRATLDNMLYRKRVIRRDRTEGNMTYFVLVEEVTR